MARYPVVVALANEGEESRGGPRRIFFTSARVRGRGKRRGRAFPQLRRSPRSARFRRRRRGARILIEPRREAPGYRDETRRGVASTREEERARRRVVSSRGEPTESLAHSWRSRVANALVVFPLPVVVVVVIRVSRASVTHAKSHVSDAPLPARPRASRLRVAASLPQRAFFANFAAASFAHVGRNGAYNTRSSPAAKPPRDR